MLRQATLTDVLLLALLAALYGSAFSAIKLAVPEIGPFGLVVARVVIGFAILLPYAVRIGWVWPGSKTSWALIIVLCIFNLILPFFLVSWAQQHLNASLMALLMGAGPLFGLIMSHVATRDDRLSANKLLGVAIGFAGIAIVIGVDALSGLSGGDMDRRLAQAAALLASASYAVSGVFVRRITDVPSQQLACLVLGMASVVLLVAMPVLAPDALDRLAHISTPALWATLYLGALVTGAAYILRYHLIRTVGMSYFGLSIYLVPVFGIAIAAVGLGEPIGRSLIVGLGLILCGMAVARLSPRRARATEREAPNPE